MSTIAALLLGAAVGAPYGFDPGNAYDNPDPNHFNATTSLYVPDLDILEHQSSGPGIGGRAFSMRRVLQALIDSGGPGVSPSSPDALFAEIWRTQCQDPNDSNPRTNCEPLDDNGFPTHCADQSFCDLATATGPDDFKPLVLVNRVDMMNSQSCGQARIIFQRHTVASAGGGHVDLQEGDKLPLVIFEMNVPNPAAASVCPIDDGCRQWADRWAQLSDPTMSRSDRRQALEQMYFDGFGPYAPVVRWSALKEGVGALRIFGHELSFETEDEWWNNDVYAPFFACNGKTTGAACTTQWSPDGVFGGSSTAGTCAPSGPAGRLACLVGGQRPGPPDRPLGFFQVNLRLDRWFVEAEARPAEALRGGQSIALAPSRRLVWRKGLLDAAPHPGELANNAAYFDWFLDEAVPALASANHIAQIDLPRVGTPGFPNPAAANTQDGIMYGSPDPQTYAGFGQSGSPLQSHVDLALPHGGISKWQALQDRLVGIGAASRMNPEQVLWRANMASCVGCHDFDHGANPAKREAQGATDLGRVDAGPGLIAYPEFKGAGFWFFEFNQYFNPATPCNEPAGPGESGLCNLPSIVGNQSVTVCGATFSSTPVPHLDWSTAGGPGTAVYTACHEARTPDVFLDYRGVLMSAFLQSTSPVCTEQDLATLHWQTGASLANVVGIGPIDDEQLSVK